MNYSAENPLFFVFTCVKDGRNYIEKLFNSLINQTKINFVHYIYEDGSTEPLNEIIDNYREQVSKLKHPYKVIYEQNGVNIGLNKATQHCISKCTCPYFIWIDCDNFIDSHFFEEMEKLYLKNKNSLLLRSVLYKAEDPSHEYFCNCGSIKESKSKFQLGLFIRRRYYYSFFAVNYKLYLSANPSNFLLPDRNFYNDEQLLIICLLNCKSAPLTRLAKGYFLTRDGQESKQFELSLNEIQAFQLKLCSKINSEFETRLNVIYLIRDLYNNLNNAYRTNFKESRTIIKKIKALSLENNIPLKYYYKPCLLRYRLKMFYWRLRSIKNS